jgi:hypothetical protein
MSLLMRVDLTHGRGDGLEAIEQGLPESPDVSHTIPPFIPELFSIPNKA